MKLNKLLFTAVAGFATLLVGLQEYDEDKHHYDNQLFYFFFYLLRKKLNLKRAMTSYRMACR